MNRKSTRRDFLKTVGVAAAGLAPSGCATRMRAASVFSDHRPNIVVIMADDMGYSDIGCYGGEIHTPHLDRLASGGVRFIQAYNTARCCPTRACLMTGLYPHQAGVGHMMDDRGTDGYQGDLNERCVTIAEVLKAAGYATYMSGKWHVTKHVGHWSGNEALTSKHNWPCQRGFHRFYGTITGAGSFYDPVTLVRDNTPLPSPAGDFYYTDAISECAVDYISTHDKTSTGQPFFLYVAYTAPHWPLHALEADVARYKRRYDAGWDALRQERLKRMVAMRILDPKWKPTARDKRVKPWEKEDHKAWQARRMEVYAAQVDRLDQGIGRILSALETTGTLDNTLVLFLADNGGCAEEVGPKWRGLHITRQTRDGRPVRLGNNPHVTPGPEDTYQSYGVPWANASNTPFRLYKHWSHEGGISTPFIAHWPARIAGRGELRSEPVHLIDIMATCVDVAAATYPKTCRGQAIHPMEGVSLVPAFDGNPLGERALYWEHEGNRAIRCGKWKLVAKGPKGPWELYDMEADRTEINDLAQRFPDRAKQMAREWFEWAERANVLPLCGKWPHAREIERSSH